MQCDVQNIFVQVRGSLNPEAGGYRLCSNVHESATEDQLTPTRGVEQPAVGGRFAAAEPHTDQLYPRPENGYPNR